jgi:hypothetical protein
MLFLRKYLGRKTAIKLYWLVILFTVCIAVLDRFTPFSDYLKIIVLVPCFAVCALLGIYIRCARKKYSINNLEFIFSQERCNSVEMHFTRTSCEEIKHLRTTLMTAVFEMHSYGKSIGAKRLIFESPLLDEKLSLTAAATVAKKLSVKYQLHQPKALSWIVSVLAYREISKCCKSKPSLGNALSVNLVMHGFSLYC